MTARRHSPFAAALAGLACLVCLQAAARADTLSDADRLLKQGHPAEALDQVDQYLSTKPKDAQGRFLRGVILSELNRPQDAATVFTKLTEDFPELPEPYNNLAVIYAQQKQYEKAKQALEMAIRTHPAYATAHENLGDIYARMASQAYDKALQLDSSNASAQFKLAMIRDLMSGNIRPATGKAVAAAAAPSPPVRVAVAKPEAKGDTKPQAKAPESAKPTSAYLPPPAQAPAAAGNIDGEVTRLVESWVDAWSKKDVKRYLAFYADDFEVPDGRNRSAWEAARTQRIDKPGAIHVSYENLRISGGGPDSATAKFRQHYRSASLKTSSNKVLVLVRRVGKWQIQRERVGS